MQQVFLTVFVALLVSAGSYLAFNYFRSKTKEEKPKEEQKAPVYRAPAAQEGAEIAAARARAREIVFEAKEQALKVKSEAEERASAIKREAVETEKKLSVEKASLEARLKELEAQKASLEAVRGGLEKKRQDLEELYKQQQEKLQKIANLTPEQAKNQLIESFERELVQEKGRKIKEAEEEIKRTADAKAQEILVDAMRHGATDYVVEYTVSKVKLPDEDMKGRIIGKEGRNIKNFEELTGVELELDSTPGEVLVSSFDPVRREIAKVALEKLIADGRIQPARIEEVVDKTKKEIDNLMFKEGDNLCHRIGVYNLPKDLISLLGRFKYRFSYGQNMIEHTLEETRIGMAIAQELGVNVEVVKLGCLLHDVGKVITDEEGSHVEIGVDLLKKYDINKNVIACVAEHHEDRPFSSVESAVVNLADHISGARPGARSEDYESYAKRMKDLESAARSFDGIENVYAVSAGREVRVFVKPEIVDDASTSLLAREIARKIELEQTYPGIVKVTVIRETRVSETAK